MNYCSPSIVQLIILSCPIWSPEESAIDTDRMTFFGEVEEGDESRGKADSLGVLAPES